MNNSNSAQSAKPASTFNYGYIIVAASFLIVMMNVGMYLSMGVFFKPISLDMGWTRADTSLPITISTLITAIGTIVAGNLVDKFGPRKVAFVVALCTASGYLLMSQLNSLWQFYLYFGLLIGAGASLMAPLLSLIPRWFTSRRTVMAGVISAGGGVGGLVMPLLADWLISSYGWHRAYLVMGIIYLVIVITAVQFLRRSPAFPIAAPPAAAAARPTAAPAPASDQPLKGVFQSRNFWLMVVMCFTFGFIANIINLHSAPHATDIGISSTAAAGLLSVMNGVSILGCIALGAVGDRFGNQKMMIITFIVEGAAVFWLASINGLLAFNIFMIIYGLAFGSGLAQTSPLVARLFGTRSLGLILGIITFAQTIGSGLGIYLPGFIYDMNKDYFWAFIAGGTLAFVAVIATLSLKMKPSLRKRS